MFSSGSPRGRCPGAVRLLQVRPPGLPGWMPRVGPTSAGRADVAPPRSNARKMSPAASPQVGRVVPGSRSAISGVTCRVGCPLPSATQRAARRRANRPRPDVVLRAGYRCWTRRQEHRPGGHRRALSLFDQPMWRAAGGRSDPVVRRVDEADEGRAFLVQQRVAPFGRPNWEVRLGEARRTWRLSRIWAYCGAWRQPGRRDRVASPPWQSRSRFTA
jgi:hypothetical protein